MSLSESGPKFRVAICGAGIGGLVLAITIGKYDPSIPIDLYEAHDSIDTAGVGITVWPKTHDVMINLGLFDEFEQIFTYGPEHSPGQMARRSDMREGGYLWFQTVHRHGPSLMHRQQMVAILERHLPASCTVHPKKRLVSYVEPEQEDAHSTSPIRLEFADGTTATTDVLIGADGIRSTVRKTMFEAASKDDGEDKTDLKQYIDATFTGITIYRALVAQEVLRKENPEHISLKKMTAYIGKGRNIVTYPIAKGTIINLAALTSNPSLTGTQYEGHWVSDATHDEVVEYFEDFEPDVRTLVKLCEKPSKWALHVVKPLPFCVRKRVALIGDACHAMTPHYGAGAGQAIDDAFVLGRLIAHPLTSLSRVQDALRIYEDVRLPIALSVASHSLSTGWMYSFLAPGYYDGARTEDDLDDSGIGSYEREGMEVIKQELLRRWGILDGLKDALQAWEDAELKLVGAVSY
ncbi:FAD/NAD(P)-binding domain-containing protein [Boletus edulis BED1]|uniref:FAD/NAD(P)-binding domain-containing protein n=1 Tax=Boletus edulis BED1 TaxID=1328754 RepID=A0AAD4BF86_BOLED|nr:FAD/NAD(P)-binding domain-containing protein [Boletus edulis BED1]